MSERGRKVVAGATGALTLAALLLTAGCGGHPRALPTTAATAGTPTPTSASPTVSVPASESVSASDRSAPTGSSVSYQQLVEPFAATTSLLAEVTTFDRTVDAAQRQRFAALSTDPARVRANADDHAWLKLRTPVCSEAYNGSPVTDGLVGGCLLGESQARLRALEGSATPPTDLRSTDNAQGPLSYWISPKGTLIGELSTQGDNAGGSIIAWTIIAESAGFTVRYADFVYVGAHSTVPGVVPSGAAGSGPANGARLAPGAMGTFLLDYQHLDAAGAGNTPGHGYCYAPGATVVAAWH